MEKEELRKLIAIWFEEDIRDGDHTSLMTVRWSNPAMGRVGSMARN